MTEMNTKGEYESSILYFNPKLNYRIERLCDPHHAQCKIKYIKEQKNLKKQISSNFLHF